MKRFTGAVTVGFCLLAGAGCTPPAAPPPTTPTTPIAKRATTLQDRPGTPTPAAPAAERAIAASAAPATSDVLARVGTRAITKDQLLEPMIEAYGLNFLIQVVQLDLAAQAAAQQGITVTQDDVKQERELTFRRMFKDSDDALRDKLKEAQKAGDAEAVKKLEAELNVDREPLLDQYLVQQFAQTRQHLSRAEFDLALATNAHLRKIAEASPEIDKALTEDLLRKSFAAQYGEKIIVRHIQSPDIVGISEAIRRLQAGENFADVAKAVSTNKITAPEGGAITPFTINSTHVPEIFRQTAFAMKDGQVSDAVSADNAFHVIKVEGRIAPKIVKYEDVRDSLRADLRDKILQNAVEQLRRGLSAQVVANLQIEHPTLKAQYERKREEGKVRQQAQIDEAMKRDRANAASDDAAKPSGPAAPLANVGPAAPAASNGAAAPTPVAPAGAATPGPAKPRPASATKPAAAAPRKAPPASQ